MTGIAVGMIVVPPFIRYLLDHYAFQGCALIFGAVVANCCVASMVFHPLRWHQRKDSGFQKTSLRNLKNCTIDCPNQRVQIEKKSRVVVVLRSALGHLKQIKHLRMVILTVSFAGFMIGYANFAAQIPFALRENEYERTLAPYCISISAMGSAVVRIIISFLSDKSWFSRKICYISGCVISGLCCISEY